MAPTFASDFSVPLKDSLSFARLSGDYNPLHVDPTAARRTQFGGTVVHGIHLFLRSLDALAAQKLFDRSPLALSATFNRPILTGATVELGANIEASSIRIRAESNGQLAFSGSIELIASASKVEAIEDAEFVSAYPNEVDFPPAVLEATVPLQLSRAQLSLLFPALVDLEAQCWIADLLATTQIVGMRCPGLHSIYSGFRLQRVTQVESTQTSMLYRINGVEKRFRLVRMGVTGVDLTGTIEAFFRPHPVAQRPMKDVVTSVPPGAFAGHRALIIGGSRGLGELVAKILASGGADVTITYAQGREDAERVCADARATGRKCTARHLDITELIMGTPPGWLVSSRYSHVHFFASPLITRNIGKWNETLFQRFAQMYVTAFSAVVDHILSGRTDNDLPVHILYPSSVFVTEPEAGFAEYAVAKAAGENLCDQLARRPGARFAKPRLPRLRTDQTSTLPDSAAADPLPVMLDVVRSFHSR